MAGLFIYSSVEIDEFEKEEFALEKIGEYFGENEYYLEALEKDSLRVIELFEDGDDEVNDVLSPLLRPNIVRIQDLLGASI